MRFLRIIGSLAHQTRVSRDPSPKSRRVSLGESRRTSRLIAQPLRCPTTRTRSSTSSSRPRRSRPASSQPTHRRRHNTGACLSPRPVALIPPPARVQQTRGQTTRWSTQAPKAAEFRSCTAQPFLPTAHIPAPTAGSGAQTHRHNRGNRRANPSGPKASGNGRLSASWTLGTKPRPGERGGRRNRAPQTWWRRSGRRITATCVRTSSSCLRKPRRSGGRCRPSPGSRRPPSR